MEKLEIERGRVVVSLSADDVRLILSAINETVEAVEQFELQTRTGFTKGEMENFRAELLVISSELARNHGPQD